ncbi:SBBP repeat-containing protein [Chondrinema litorale]|uniref:SBBP repeat-containing protein n=1 Tax=Chondrinema litorale TaxID=2994555 RepID=UPI002542D5C8|nr:SBBP repeat-containing protein [Chondrinema litorale]UZR93461.1 SBBP repeat-containing protein [Chondrinema litorale]
MSISKVVGFKLYLVFGFIIASFNGFSQNLDWAKSFGGNSNDFGVSHTIDFNGDIITTGVFEGTADFNPREEIYNLISNGDKDIFIQKVNSTGDFLWAKSIGGISTDVGYDVTTDSEGNIYLTGYFTDSVDFDPGEDIYFLSSYIEFWQDAFILKLDQNGAFLWAHKIGGLAGESGYAIEVDTDGNVYTLGYFQNDIDFDPGVGINILEWRGDTDIFLQKLDTNGNFIWVKHIGGNAEDIGRSMVIDSLGFIYVIGDYYSTDFDAGDGESFLNNVESSDVFVSKFDRDGDLVWAKSMGGESSEKGRGIFVDDSGNVYSTGSFIGKVDFDPGEDSTFLDGDIFIQKLDAEANLVWAKSIEISGGAVYSSSFSITSDAKGNVYILGSFHGIADFDPGEEEYELITDANAYIFLLKLDSKGNFIRVTPIVRSSNEYGYSLTSDTQDNLVITGNFINTSDFDPSSETSLMTSKGGNDIFTLKLNPCYIEILTDPIFSCTSYTWIDGNTYTESNNTATHTIANAEGCDSVITLNLTISNINSEVVQDGSKLTTVEENATYQWIDCDSNTPIAGATDQSFIPTFDGNYSVEITRNECSETSACFPMTVLGVIKSSFENEVLVYPNPTDGYLKIELEKQINKLEVKVITITGQQVDKQVFNDEDKIELYINVNSGIYLIELTSIASKENKRALIRVVKK